MKGKIVQAVLLSLVHFMICVLSGSLGWDKQTVIVPVVTLLAMVFANKKTGINAAASTLPVLPFFIVYTGVSMLVDVEYPTYPVWIMGWATLLFTFLLLQFRIARVASILILSLLVSFGGLILWPNTFAWAYTEKKPSARNMNGVGLLNYARQPVDPENLKGKVILFDLWSTSCYNCIKKFPELQKLYDSYRNDTAVRIIALNVPLKLDKEAVLARLTAPYSFEKMYFSDTAVARHFSANGLPLVLIMDKHFTCRYAGQLNTGWNIFYGNADRIINNLINE
ncbi:MAG: TlpA disulfide reductase family protein [Bacteroidetes bacterium]|nr:TlpA disulfide reductase family protein [Bacteroidota bacterium]